jgi:hypothetical protein
MSALAAQTLTGTIAAAICDEQVLKPNRLAWVTQHFLIVRNADRQNHTIIPLARLTGIDLVKTPYSGLLAIAAGVFVIAAAAFASKQGDGAAVPSALLGIFLIAGYFGTRRASISFRLDSGATETMVGTVAEATELVNLVERARRLAVMDDDDERHYSVVPVFRRAPKAAAQPILGSSGLA